MAAPEIEIKGFRFPPMERRPVLPIRKLPPIGSVERFIGTFGSNVEFVLANWDEGIEYTTLSSYDFISQLGLKWGDKDIPKVMSTFSRMTQAAEIMNLGFPTFPWPKPGENFIYPDEAYQRLLARIKAGEMPIAVDYGTFAQEFIRQLRAQDEIANRVLVPAWLERP